MEPVVNYANERGERGSLHLFPLYLVGAQRSLIVTVVVSNSNSYQFHALKSILFHRNLAVELILASLLGSQPNMLTIFK